ncbi:MAG: hypothetical protein WCL61_00375 [bacterium]
MQRRNFGKTLKVFWHEVIWPIIFFPIWWYSVGVWKLVKRLWHKLSEIEHGLAVGVWLKNLFVPMYGTRDWAGRLISFLMRSTQVFFRLGALLIVLVVLLVALVAWLSLPLYLIYCFSLL